jgi:hypothetical protein
MHYWGPIISWLLQKDAASNGNPAGLLTREQARQRR